VNAIAVHAETQRLVSGDDDGIVRLWDLRQRGKVRAAHVFRVCVQLLM